MDFFSNLFFGFIVAAVGIILPGLINMTAVSVCLKKGLRSGLLYSLGASITIFAQALVAIVFADYLSENEEIFPLLKKLAIFIFLVLSGLFLFQALKVKEAKASERKGKAFVLGVLIAAMNPLNIPYYFTFGAFLEVESLISLQFPYFLAFVIGTALGGMAMLTSYSYFAAYIAQRAQYFTRNINYFLSGLFLLLAVVQIVQLI